MHSLNITTVRRLQIVECCYIYLMPKLMSKLIPSLPPLNKEKNCASLLQIEIEGFFTLKLLKGQHTHHTYQPSHLVGMPQCSRTHL